MKSSRNSQSHSLNASSQILKKFLLVVPPKLLSPYHYHFPTHLIMTKYTAVQFQSLQKELFGVNVCASRMSLSTATGGERYIITKTASFQDNRKMVRCGQRCPGKFWSRINIMQHPRAERERKAFTRKKKKTLCTQQANKIKGGMNLGHETLEKIPPKPSWRKLYLIEVFAVRRVFWAESDQNWSDPLRSDQNPLRIFLTPNGRDRAKFFWADLSRSEQT